MKRIFLSQETAYTGSELRSLWAYSQHGLQGDSVVAFAGPCDVPTEALVDEEDRREGAFIRSEKMLHFIVEHFERDLEKAILRQLFLVGLVQEEIHRCVGRHILNRRGDDLFHDGRKLSVSIATLSPVSALIHLGLNITPRGAPVPAVGLDELAVPVRPLGEAVIEAYAEAMERIPWMKSKVRGVE